MSARVKVSGQSLPKQTVMVMFSRKARLDNKSIKGMLTV